jgi:hypothetical protein
MDKKVICDVTNIRVRVCVSISYLVFHSVGATSPLQLWSVTNQEMDSSTTCARRSATYGTLPGLLCARTFASLRLCD